MNDRPHVSAASGSADAQAGSDAALLAFDAAGLAGLLGQLGDDQLDALDYGVVEMRLTGEVTRYNATETRYSGLSRERTIGRHFFRDVAPCSNNRHVAGRFALPSVDVTLDYIFALRMKLVPVTLRLLKPLGGTSMHLLVRWT